LENNDMGCVAYNPLKLIKEIQDAAEKPVDLEKYRTKRKLGRSLDNLMKENRRQERSESLMKLFRGDHHE